MRTLLVSLVIAAALTGTAARPADAQTTSTLPDSLETIVLTATAAGDIAKADSLRQVFTAKAVLAQKTAAAAAELAKRNEAEWSKEVKPLSMDQVLGTYDPGTGELDLTGAWVAADEPAQWERFEFLCKRYWIPMPKPASTFEGEVRSMRERLYLRSRMRFEAAAGSKSVSALEERVKELEAGVRVLATGHNDQEDALASLRVDMEATMMATLRSRADIYALMGVTRRAKLHDEPKSSGVLDAQIELARKDLGIRVLADGTVELLDEDVEVRTAEIPSNSGS